MGPPSHRTRSRRTSTSCGRSSATSAAPGSRPCAGSATGVRAEHPCSLSRPARSAGTDDAALLRRTRVRLLAWSAGLTILILVILGTLVYGAVSRELANRGTSVLVGQAQEVARVLRRPGPLPDRMPFGVTFGGEGSGTLTPGDPARRNDPRAARRGRGAAGGGVGRGRPNRRQRRSREPDRGDADPRLLGRHRPGRRAVDRPGRGRARLRAAAARSAAGRPRDRQPGRHRPRARGGLVLRRPRPRADPRRDGSARRRAEAPAGVHGERQPRAPLSPHGDPGERDRPSPSIPTSRSRPSAPPSRTSMPRPPTSRRSSTTCSSSPAPTPARSSSSSPGSTWPTSRSRPSGRSRPLPTHAASRCVPSPCRRRSTATPSASASS